MPTISQTWTMDHDLHVLAQCESRPGPLTEDGERWMERRPTGKVTAVCTCGCTTGLVNRDDLPSIEALKADHPTP